MRAWVERSVEQAALFNPAFITLVLASASRGARDDGGLPWPLAFVVGPLALHRPTREALPGTTATSLPVWLERNPHARVGLPQRASDLAHLTREALRLGLAAGALELASDRLRAGAPRRRTKAVRRSPEVDECFKRAEFLGRWFAGSGDVATIFGHLGLRP